MIGIVVFTVAAAAAFFIGMFGPEVYAKLRRRRE